MILTENNLKNDEKLSSREELEKDYPCTSKFLDFFQRKYVITKTEKNVYRIYLFTEIYEYGIVIFGEYCGGFTTLRKNDIMEPWKRGNDLYDGKPSEEMFNEIALDILRNELITLGEIEFKPFEELYGQHIEESFENNKKGPE